MRTRVHSSSSLLPHSSRDADKFILHSRPRRVDHKPLSIAALDQSHVTFPRFFSFVLSLSLSLSHAHTSLPLSLFLFLLRARCFLRIFNDYQSPCTLFIYSRLVFIQPNFSCSLPIKLHVSKFSFFKYDFYETTRRIC